LTCERGEYSFEAVVRLRKLAGSSLDRLSMALVPIRHVDTLNVAPAAFAANGLAIALVQLLMRAGGGKKEGERTLILWCL
jgi:hypothetical protein